MFPMQVVFNVAFFITGNGHLKFAAYHQNTYKSEWPSGLRRCVQVAVYVCRRGFESHF